MSKQKDGGTAFPAIPPHITHDRGTNTFDVVGDEFVGMSLRDYFAGQALASGLRAYYSIQNERCSPYEFAAREAYLYADALLARRDEPQ